MGRNKVRALTYQTAAMSLNIEIRSAPVTNLTFPTSTETITSVRFNLSESSVLASIGSDRTFTLYDIRTGKAERRVVMQVGKHHSLLCCTDATCRCAVTP